jgi:phage-related holin
MVRNPTDVFCSRRMARLVPGRSDGFLYALLAFVILDYITGFMCAIVNRKLYCEIGFKGIFKKVLIFGLVGIGSLIDMYLIG